jgi:signal transduction histidine kinase
MTYRSSLVRTGVFAVAYLAAVWAGRLTVMDSTNLSMVWPAAGIGVIWFLAQRKAPARWADVAALAVITCAVNTATGASTTMAGIFVVANLVQLWVFLRLTEQWGGDRLRTTRDLWGLLAAAFISTVAGAALGPTGMWLLTDRYSWPATFVWLARNTASILLIGAAGLLIGQAAAAYRERYGDLSGWWRRAGRTLAATPRPRLAEYAALALCSTAAYLAGFAYAQGLPIAFTLIAVTVWAGTRLSTPFVVLHDLVVGVIAVVFTLSGQGPFANIPDPATRAFVAQLFVAIVAVVGLVLALGRDERAELLAELAAEKAELAAFAGVVAHDLLNPVTAVQGWAETATDAVELAARTPETARALDALERVERAAVRMRSLIDGLLDHATARDGAFTSQPVDLGRVVADVTVARLDAAIAAGLPAPRFTVADLPAVQADPVLIRQLLDNRIGNAIKYTAPGVTPALTVTATRTGGMVQVCVADNGIGIPEGQHDEIFGNFHRAHSTLGYAGTGLGLGICRRIVERHGGTITATDNPGGGSRFVFSVPAATPPTRQPVPDSAQLH